MSESTIDVIEAMKGTRSIRKYTNEQVPREVLDKILEAGSYAANAGGGQRTIFVAIRNAGLARRLGVLNMQKFDRSKLIGNKVSGTQPSVIDDLTQKNGFYDAPCVVIIFALRNFMFGIPDAFICAQTMAYAAHSLGVSSCIISRAEDTFSLPEAQELQTQWGVPETYQARCFLTLGFCEGDYPEPKPRREGRIVVVE